MPIQFFSVNPTVTAGAYSANDVVGGLLTFKGLRRGSLQTVTITDKAKQSPDYLLVLFNDTPTTIADNATYAIADADLPKILRQISLTASANRQAFSDNCVYTSAGLDIPLGSFCASITGFLIATASAPTYASTSDVTVVLQVDTDYVSGRNQGSSNIAAVQVGDAAGGELDGTYPSPTVDATHSGSSHANLPAGAQVNSVDIATISGSQTLTNKTINADNSTITNLAHGSEVDNLTTSHGVTGTIVGTGGSQTLSSKTFSNDTIFQDDAAVKLGTGGDARLYYSGSDTVLDLRTVGTGDLMIAFAGSFPAPDPDTVHIWRGTAGVIAAASAAGLVLEDDAQILLQFLTPATASPGINFGDPGGSAIGRILYDHTVDTLEFYTNSVEVVDIDASGDINLLTGGVNFPDTQVSSADANTLDDYEEGTFTPTLSFTTPGNLSVGYSYAVGTYTKTGRKVTVTFDVLTTSFTFTTSAGNLLVASLPFTSMTLSNAQWSGAVAFQGYTKALYTQATAHIGDNATTAGIWLTGSGQVLDSADTIDVPTTTTIEIHGTITYFTA